MKPPPLPQKTAPYNTRHFAVPAASPRAGATESSTLPERIGALKEQIRLLQTLRGVRLSGHHTYPIQMPVAAPPNSPGTSRRRSPSFDSLAPLPLGYLDASHLPARELIERTAGMPVQITEDFPSNLATFEQVGKEDVCCAQDIQEVGVRAEEKPEPITDAVTIKGLNEFCKTISELADTHSPDKSTGYIKDIALYTNEIHARLGKQENPTDHHDISILVSEVMADVMGKVLKHRDQPETNALAKKVLQALLNENFSDHFRKSEFRYLFFPSGSRDLISSETLLNHFKIHSQLVDEVYTPREHSLTTPNKDRVYQEAASITMRMKKPDSNPTWMGGFPRVDSHYHNHPYDDYSTNSKFSPLSWEERMMRSLNIAHTSIMPIPHRILESMLKGKASQNTLNHPAAHAYYADPGATTVFCGHDATMILHHNELPKGESRARFILCATGLPVDINRVGETGEIAYAYSFQLALAQLQEGRKHIAVNFGEITGYKPAVPQKMLGGNSRIPTIIQAKFVEGSTRILTEIFQKSQEGIAEALKLYEAQPGASLDGIHTKTRITYHADALPNQEALERGENKKDDGSLKEATRVSDIITIAKQIDENLGSSHVDFPEGVTHDHHLQAAHLMGASIEPNNFTDPSRATELHKAFRTFRTECNNLRVTTDASWLTASARAINHGMAHFFSESKDKDLKEIGELITLADDLSNDSFMFLHAGERHFESSLLKGDNKIDTLLNMAVMRSAQKKAVRTYHATLGALHDKLNNEGIIDKVQRHVNAGCDYRGLVHEGNYPGLFLQLAKEGSGIKQDKTPIVWGSDNLTASNARSGDLKMLQYTSQHGPLEIILFHLGDTARAPLLDFLSGTSADQAYLGSQTKVDPGKLGDGQHPLDPATNRRAKTHGGNPLRYLNAAKFMIMPFPKGKTTTLSPGQEASPGASASADPDPTGATGATGANAVAGTDAGSIARKDAVRWVQKGVGWVRAT